MVSRKSLFTPDAIRLSLAALALSTLVLSAGCNALDFIPLASATKTLREVFSTSDAPQIIVETYNGQIDISPSDSNEVVVEVTKRASGFDQQEAEANLERIEVSMTQKGNVIVVSAQRIGMHHGNSGAAIVVSAPAASLVQLKTSNGKIVCEAMEGGVEAHSSNGKLEAIQTKGKLKLTTSNGGIEIEATDAVVDARTSNGRIDFKGTLAARDQEFKTSNEKIELTLPADTQFELDASTSNSRVGCEFPLKGEHNKRRTKLKGTVGDSPAFSITATSSNGPINIRKASGSAK